MSVSRTVLSFTVAPPERAVIDDDDPDETLSIGLAIHVWSTRSRIPSGTTMAFDRVCEVSLCELFLSKYIYA